MSLTGWTHVCHLVLLDGYHNLLVEPTWAEVGINHNRYHANAARHQLTSYRRTLQKFMRKAHPEESSALPLWTFDTIKSKKSSSKGSGRLLSGVQNGLTVGRKGKTAEVNSERITSET